MVNNKRVQFRFVGFLNRMNYLKFSFSNNLVLFIINLYL